MAFGPQLFGGQMSTISSPELVSPPALVDQEMDFSQFESEDNLGEDIAALAGNSEPTKGIQLNDSMISPQAVFMTRSGEQVMANKNPEGFLRQGGLIVDNENVYLDSMEQSQVPTANLRGALIRMVQMGIPQIRVRSFTKDKVFSANELVKRRFRLV